MTWHCAPLYARVRRCISLTMFVEDPVQRGERRGKTANGRSTAISNSHGFKPMFDDGLRFSLQVGKKMSMVLHQSRNHVYSLLIVAFRSSFLYNGEGISITIAYLFKGGGLEQNS